MDDSSSTYSNQNGSDEAPEDRPPETRLETNHQFDVFVESIGACANKNKLESSQVWWDKRAVTAVSMPSRRDVHNN